MKILIFPFAKPIAQGKFHPKNYPWWPELLEMLKSHTIIQVGTDGEHQLVDDFRKNLSITDLSTLIRECDTWIGIDSFGQHLCWELGVKGIVIFGQSDPNIFGHSENINLLKDRKYLREKQFWLWEQTEFNSDAFVTPEEIIKVLTLQFPNK
jgi:ADP-heptose:LPS heptosyltransferase